MTHAIVAYLSRFLPTEYAFAHCDVPCGIYDPTPARIAAATVKRMVQLIGELPEKNPSVAERNKFVRCVLTKEAHAQKCKEELLILWTDYFKPEHLSQFPVLHEVFWKATKLCSKNKQEVSVESADALVAAVDEIAHMFEASKKAQK